MYNYKFIKGLLPSLCPMLPTHRHTFTLYLNLKNQTKGDTKISACSNKCIKEYITKQLKIYPIP